jgi:hypothetical protein
MTAAELNRLDDTEFERVIRWRVDELTRAGYDWPASMLIAARPDIDLHAAGRLLERGCPVDTALRILL